MSMMERDDEEQTEMETQAVSTTASRVSRMSELAASERLSAEDMMAEGERIHPLTKSVESLSIQHMGASPRTIENSLMETLLQSAVPSPKDSRDSFLAGLGRDLVRAALPTPTSSQDLRPNVVTFRLTGEGSGEPPLTPDCEYLRRHLGKPLVAALAEVAAKRPADPIHYLGHWLYRWRADSELREAKTKKINLLNAERESVAVERRAREEEQRRARVIEIAGHMVKEALDRSMEHPPPTEEEDGATGDEEMPIPV